MTHSTPLPDPNEYRYFDLVVDKLAEATFHLEKMGNPDLNPFEVRAYFSAFVSAARSITWVMQKVMTHVPGFKDWYAHSCQVLANDGLGAIFVAYRNATLHKGNAGINYVSPNAGGPGKAWYFFSSNVMHSAFLPFGSDVESLARRYLARLHQLVADCRAEFAWFLNYDELLTEQGLLERQITVEDVEEMLGLPRGATSTMPLEERLSLLRQVAAPSVASAENLDMMHLLAKIGEEPSMSYPLKNYLASLK